MSKTPSDTNRRYIGDGVYVSFDGYHVAISLNDHLATPVVHLEKEVLDALTKYGQEMFLPKPDPAQVHKSEPPTHF